MTSPVPGTATKASPMCRDFESPGSRDGVRATLAVATEARGTDRAARGWSFTASNGGGATGTRRARRVADRPRPARVGAGRNRSGCRVRAAGADREQCGFTRSPWRARYTFRVATVSPAAVRVHAGESHLATRLAATVLTDASASRPRENRISRDDLRPTVGPVLARTLVSRRPPLTASGARAKVLP